MTKILKKKPKTITQFRPQVRSRHPSHSPLRSQLQKLSFPAVVRLGSTTELEDVKSKGGKRVEVNTVQAIRTSASKLLMKRAFEKAGVKTAVWKELKSVEDLRKFFEEHKVIVVKSHYGSRGQGNTLVKTKEELNKWISTHGGNVTGYIAEKFYNYSREYRLHVTSEGCFYTCRKVLRQETPEKDRWFRNDSNSNWIMENNPLFDKPANWNVVVAECVKALNAVGLDVGAIDLRIQSAKDGQATRKNPEFIVLETNSAPSFGERTLEMYLQEIPKIIKRKA